MRILLLTDDYLPHRGGSRVYYHNLLLGLKNTEATVLTREREGGAEFDRDLPYRVARCPLAQASWLRPLRLQALPVYWSLFRHALRLMREEPRPDVIAAGELVPTGPIAAILAWLFRRPLLLFTHAEGPATLSRTRFQSRLARWTCRRARRIVVSSDYAQDLLADLWGIPREKVETILPGVEEAHFDPRYVADPCAAPHRPLRLLSVSRLVERKGHQAVIQALPRVLEAAPDLRYTIVGEGPLRAQLQESARAAGVEKSVRFVGALAPEALYEEFARSDCFVLPNVDSADSGDTEGFGIVFVEASAHGLPVVGGRTGGTRQSIVDGSSGFRVDGRDVGAVANALIRVLREPGLATTFGQSGREWALKEMQWERRSERFDLMLKKFVEGDAQEHDETEA